MNLLEKHNGPKANAGALPNFFPATRDSMFFDPAIVSCSLNDKTVHFLDFEHAQAQTFEQAQADVKPFLSRLLRRLLNPAR